MKKKIKLRMRISGVFLSHYPSLIDHVMHILLKKSANPSLRNISYSGKPLKNAYTSGLAFLISPISKQVYFVRLSNRKEQVYITFCRRVAIGQFYIE
jgi:hypothetical protein